MTTKNRLLVSSRREAALTLIAWAVACLWSVGYSTTYGYRHSSEDLHFIAGFPAWVFGGVIAPWGLCYLFSACMAFFIMEDAPLEDDSPEEQLSSETHSAEGDE